MSKYLDGTSLYTGIAAGLSNTFGLIASQYGTGGITLENLKESATNKNLLQNTNYNATFSSYLTSNFSNIDQDGDGVLTAQDLQSHTSEMTAKGMTREQLSTLGTSSGLSSSLLETVLSNFDEIDSNNDGKVTNAEIKAYSINSAYENQRTADMNRMIANMSTFYGDDIEVSEGSLLDYKYQQDKSSN